MDVEHALLPAPHEPWREQAHESGKADDVDAMRLERALQRAFEGLSIGELPMLDERGGEPGRARRRQPFGVGLIGHDERDLGRVGGALRGRQQRRHVGAAPGDEDGHPFADHAAHRRPSSPA